MAETNLKVCFAASSGGHYEQLMMLKPLMKQYNSFIVTEKTRYKSGNSDMKYYYLQQVNRQEKGCLLGMLRNTMRSVSIYMKERPDVVICTGVLAMIPICLLTKLFGGKLIYVESFAKVNSATLTGKLLYRFADRFYVQWESMKEIYPNAVYCGGIY